MTLSQGCCCLPAFAGVSTSSQSLNTAISWKAVCLSGCFWIRGFYCWDQFQLRGDQCNMWIQSNALLNSFLTPSLQALCVKFKPPLANITQGGIASHTSLLDQLPPCPLRTYSSGNSWEAKKLPTHTNPAAIISENFPLGHSSACFHHPSPLYRAVLTSWNHQVNWMVNI